jgi:hypothetical protein
MRLHTSCHYHELTQAPVLQACNYMSRVAYDTSYRDLVTFSSEPGTWDIFSSRMTNPLWPKML